MGREVGPLEEGDPLDQERLLAALRKHRIEAVLHFAAFAFVGESMQGPELYFRNNVAGTMSLLDAMRTAGSSPPGVFLHLRRIRNSRQGPD